MGLLFADDFKQLVYSEIHLATYHFNCNKKKESDIDINIPKVYLFKKYGRGLFCFKSVGMYACVLERVNSN